MKHRSLKISILVMVFSILLVSFTANEAVAQSVPDWVKNTALWYGEGVISEGEFLNMIKFLIENEVIVVEMVEEPLPQVMNAEIFIPNGNFDVTGAGFYSPLNLEITVGTAVTWINDDSVPHNIQSMDDSGDVIQLFNSPPLNTGDKFEFTFEESGVYNYFCSFHPWRVGVVTVS